MNIRYCKEIFVNFSIEKFFSEHESKGCLVVKLDKLLQDFQDLYNSVCLYVIVTKSLLIPLSYPFLFGSELSVSVGRVCRLIIEELC